MLGARFFQEGKGDGRSPRFPLILDSQKEGMAKEVVGGDSRMRALQQLYEEYLKENRSSEQNFKIFTTGGIEKIQTDFEVLELSRAEEAKKKLSEKYGLPEEIVQALPSSGSTLGNAAALAKWINQHLETIGDVHDIEIITNEFHITRAWVMFATAFYKNEYGRNLELDPEDVRSIEAILDSTLADTKNGDKNALHQIQEIYEKYLKNLSIKVNPLIVEDILARRGESGEKYAERIRGNKFVLATREMERNGIKDLIHGRYQVK